ncbi:MAG: heme-binding protein [Planctomycetota bacterium]
MLTFLPIALALTLQPEAQTSEMTGSAPAADAQIQRIVPPPGEDIRSRPGREGLLYNAGDVATDTKLPVGYPRPTPPGAIEIKVYPSIRQAEVSGSGTGDRASRNGFWPLFQHISRNEIAMTAPVEMRYSDTNGDAKTDEWTMAFLYHVPENGPTGTDEVDNRVTIIDTEPVMVVSMGLQGGEQVSNSQEAEATLLAWIEESGEWERAGDTRRLGYNGPNVPVRNRWWEIQVPIRPIGDAGNETAEAATDETI